MKISFYLLLVFLLGMLDINAQKRMFKNFDVEKDVGRYVMVWPKDYKIMLNSLKIDTLIYPQVKLTTDGTFRAIYGRYEEWQKLMIKRTVPDQVSKMIQRKIGADTARYGYTRFAVGTVIDREGKYLSVYFKMSDNVLGEITEEQLQQITDSFMSQRSVEKEIMEMLELKDRTTPKQLEKCVEYMHDNMEELRKIQDFTMDTVYNRIGIKLEQRDYVRIEFPVGEYELRRIRQF